MNIYRIILFLLSSAVILFYFGFQDQLCNENKSLISIKIDDKTEALNLM